MAVDFGDRGIDHGVFQVRIILQHIEHASENIGFPPIAPPPGKPCPSRRTAPAGRAMDCPAHDPQHRLQNSRLSFPLRPDSPGLPRQCGSILTPWPSVRTLRSILAMNHISPSANPRRPRDCRSDRDMYVCSLTAIGPIDSRSPRLADRTLGLPASGGKSAYLLEYDPVPME